MKRMDDARMAALAALLLDHSIRIRPGELFEINGGLAAKPLIKALLRGAATRGAYPVVALEDDELTRLTLSCIDPAHPERMRPALEKQAAWELSKWEHVAAHIDIGVDENDAELAGVDGRALACYREARARVRQVMIDERRWVYLHYPTPADAQKAGLCMDDMFELFFAAAQVDYAAMERYMTPLVRRMERARRVRITGPGTDLTFSIEGMPVVPCAGRINIPDGEVYTAPVRESVNGCIRYNTPARRYGHTFQNPCFEFENGRIVRATCDGDAAGLNRLLDVDEGARYIGEFALGVNNALRRAIGNALYDEKIGGSFHLTPGNAYRNAFNGNRSQLHLDIVCIQTADCGGGDILFDGELIRRDGRFVPEELRGLNP